MARPKGAKTKKANPRPTGPRFTLTERERLKTKVVELDLQGHSQQQIANLVDTSKATINSLLAEINEDYKQAYVDDRKRWVMKELAVLWDVRRRAYEEIALLKERGKRKKVEKTGNKPGEHGGPYDETAETVEDPELLGWHALIVDTTKEVAGLLGLKELPAQVFAVNVNASADESIFNRLLLGFLNGSGNGTTGPPGIVDVTPGPDETPEKPG